MVLEDVVPISIVSITSGSCQNPACQRVHAMSRPPCGYGNGCRGGPAAVAFRMLQLRFSRPLRKRLHSAAAWLQVSLRMRQIYFGHVARPDTTWCSCCFFLSFFFFGPDVTSIQKCSAQAPRHSSNRSPRTPPTACQGQTGQCCSVINVGGGSQEKEGQRWSRWQRAASLEYSLHILVLVSLCWQPNAEAS